MTPNSPQPVHSSTVQARGSGVTGRRAVLLWDICGLHDTERKGAPPSRGSCSSEDRDARTPGGPRRRSPARGGRGGDGSSPGEAGPPGAPPTQRRPSRATESGRRLGGNTASRAVGTCTQRAARRWRQVNQRRPETLRTVDSRLSPLPTNDHSAGQNLSPMRAMNLQMTRGDSSAELSLRWRTKNAGDAQSLRRDSTCHRQAREAGSRDVRF